ncbi:MAG: hypothetical protein H7228_11050, partial [Polaromonas sp.]|nr:hypothetical protein [Polaromonas sp.]
MQNTIKNAITWFEIGTTNLPRATSFYETILACKMRLENTGPSEGAIFAYDKSADGTGGALICGPTAPRPGAGGMLVYLDASPSLDAALERVTKAGGQIALPRQRLLGSDTNFAAALRAVPSGRAKGLANLGSDPKNLGFFA